MIEMSFRRVLAFQQVLEAHKVACTGRVQRGVDIAAACGQFAGAIQ
ncbi:MAG: Dual-specificity RNA methyltransferase RlmN [Verrucomicrobia bacterium ADurb.Bin345]|nr:MAG: Dual-specificity RNA methyltransferase RlmN [Verrucomicrobia bacterium ADurb.Bin345]